jgi:hypothetical protein
MVPSALHFEPVVTQHACASTMLCCCLSLCKWLDGWQGNCTVPGLVAVSLQHRRALRCDAVRTADPLLRAAQPYMKKIESSKETRSPQASAKHQVAAVEEPGNCPWAAVCGRTIISLQSSARQEEGSRTLRTGTAGETTAVRRHGETSACGTALTEQERLLTVVYDYDPACICASLDGQAHQHGSRSRRNRRCSLRWRAHP